MASELWDSIDEVFLDRGFAKAEPEALQASLTRKPWEIRAYEIKVNDHLAKAHVRCTPENRITVDFAAIPFDATFYYTSGRYTLGGTGEVERIVDEYLHSTRSGHQYPSRPCGN
jgi:hypothetical protein